MQSMELTHPTCGSRASSLASRPGERTSVTRETRECELGCSRTARKMRALHETKSDIQVLHIERVVFDEFAAGFDGVAHQHGEDFVGLDGVVDADLQERARVGIHRGV